MPAGDVARVYRLRVRSCVKIRRFQSRRQSPPVSTNRPQFWRDFGDGCERKPLAGLGSAPIDGGFESPGGHRGWCTWASAHFRGLSPLARGFDAGGGGVGRDAGGGRVMRRAGERRPSRADSESRPTSEGGLALVLLGVGRKQWWPGAAGGSFGRPSSPRPRRVLRRVVRVRLHRHEPACDAQSFGEMSISPRQVS